MAMNFAGPIEAAVRLVEDADETVAAGKSIVAAKTVYGVLVDNRANSVATFVHLYDAAFGDVTPGTTAADAVLKTEAGIEQLFILNGGTGVAFATDVTVSAQTASGGDTGPTGQVSVRLFTN